MPTGNTAADQLVQNTLRNHGVEQASSPTGTPQHRNQQKNLKKKSRQLKEAKGFTKVESSKSKISPPPTQAREPETPGLCSSRSPAAKTPPLAKLTAQEPISPPKATKHYSAPDNEGFVTPKSTQKTTSPSSITSKSTVSSGVATPPSASLSKMAARRAHGRRERDAMETPNTSVEASPASQSGAKLPSNHNDYSAHAARAFAEQKLHKNAPPTKSSTATVRRRIIAVLQAEHLRGSLLASKLVQQILLSRLLLHLTLRIRRIFMDLDLLRVCKQPRHPN